MKGFVAPKNDKFVGRWGEIERLKGVVERDESSVVVVYGRRRVGKTELIEQHFRQRNLLKFEGIQVDKETEPGESRRYQIEGVLKQLAKYTEEPHIARLKYQRWSDVFDLIAGIVGTGEWTLYFEEVQWLANYQADFFSELKLVWDNELRFNKKLILVLCGSSPSFLMSELIADKAFYNRSQEEIYLQPFNLIEAKEFLGKEKAQEEVILAYLTVGGIPEYLKYLKRESSVLLSLCKNAFLPSSFFSIEPRKIFVSSLRTNKHFEKVISFLSVRRYATRDEIAKALGVKAGGSISNLLQELEACSFIEKYCPAHLSDHSIVSRYCIVDNYLQFYYKFIQSKIRDIQKGTFENNPIEPINMESFQKWLGFAFERFCRANHRVIAKILGFEAVKYKVGAFFTRENLTENRNFQIDLVYFRADHVISLCEIKYHQAPVAVSVIEEFEEKTALFKKYYSKGEKSTLQKVLIASNGVTATVSARAYFDRIITLDDLFNSMYWGKIT